jgi:twitching motility protein PilT
MDLRALLDEMHHREAIDLHLASGTPPVFRVNGQLAVFLEEDYRNAGLQRVLTASDLADITAQLDSMTLGVAPDPMKWGLEGPSRHRNARAILLRLGENAYRISVGSASGGPVIAVRVIPTHVPRLCELLEGDSVIAELAKLQHGLVIIAGQTGSGKATTLASMVQEINGSRNVRICVVGIEYLMHSARSLLTQHIEGWDCEDTADGIAQAADLDPDVIAVMELADEPSVLAALRLAERQRLVLATIHAGTVSRAVERLTQLAHSQSALVRSQLAENLQAVVAQRLVPRAGEEGSVAIHEVLLGTERTAKVIAAGVTDFAPIVADGKEDGMRSFDDSLLRLLARGAISTETVRENLDDPSRL